MKSDSPVTIHTTDQFSQGAFKPHGKWRFWAEGEVIYSVASGPFNIEFVKALGSALKEIWATHPFARPPVYVVQIEHSIMASQDMLAAYKTLHENIPPDRISPAVAFVVDREVEGREFVLPLFEKVYTDLNRSFRSFDNMPEAEAWARACLKDAAGA